MDCCGWDWMWGWGVCWGGDWDWSWDWSWDWGWGGGEKEGGGGEIRDVGVLREGEGFETMIGVNGYLKISFSR